MGGAIGEWSNSAPWAEPCHWTTWVAPVFSEKNSLDSQEIRTPQARPWEPLMDISFGTPSPPPAPPLAPSRQTGVALAFSP